MLRGQLHYLRIPGVSFMKRTNLLIAVLFLAISFAISGQTVSAAKKTEKRESRALYVQQGKTYKISKILSDTYVLGEIDTLKNCLKGKKVKWSVNKKQIKLTKNTIKVKKQDEIKLTAQTKKYKYIITLKSVPEKWPAIPEGITRVSIRKEETALELNDINTIKSLCSLFDSADYRFDYVDTNKRRLVGWSYWIKLYNADGKLERDFIIGAETLSMEGLYKKKKNIDIYNFVTAIYQSLLTGQTQDGVAP